MTENEPFKVDPEDYGVPFDMQNLDKLSVNSVYGKHPKLHRVITSMVGLAFTPYEATILINNIKTRTHPEASDTLENLPYADTDSLDTRDPYAGITKPFIMRDVFNYNGQGVYDTECLICGSLVIGIENRKLHTDWHNKVADL